MNRYALLGVVVALWAIAVVPCDADRSYDNADSLRAGRLTYVLAIDRSTYGFNDTIYSLSRVVNRTAEVETLWTDARCSGYIYAESYCSTVDSLSICDVGDTLGICLCVGEPGSPVRRLIPPGEIELGRYAIGPNYGSPPASDVTIFGNIIFCSPWPPSFVDLHVAYQRRAPLTVGLRSWSHVKRLFH